MIINLKPVQDYERAQDEIVTRYMKQQYNLGFNYGFKLGIALGLIAGVMLVCTIIVFALTN